MGKAGIGTNPPLWRRPFSLHQVSADGEQIQLLIKVVGCGTKFLSGCRPGEYLSLVGPLGHGFTLPAPDQDNNICIIGGGVGVAPLLYLTKKMLETVIVPSPDAIQFFMGGAAAAEIGDLAKDFSETGVSLSLATDDGSAGHHGLVTELLYDKLNPEKKYHVYSCGPHPMMKTIALYCLEKKWPCQVSLETLMACGVSACLGCAIRGSGQPVTRESDISYLHVCKEGPVFEAGELAWD
jgi:dihydroorotate dehydrogenase electron transfer subunit